MMIGWCTILALLALSVAAAAQSTQVLRDERKPHAVTLAET
jgi:hypothetical protein